MDLSVSYATIKTLFTSVPCYYRQLSDAGRYAIFAYSDAFFVRCMGLVEEEQADYEASYKASHVEVPSEDDARLLGNQRVGGLLITPRSTDGTSRISTQKPDSPKLTFITPNWCDKTTWYAASTYVEEEVAGDSGDHTTYDLDHQNVIDTYHGKITFEDFLKDGEVHSFRVVVKVNGTAKTEQDPHLGTGGDFTVDYVLGKITFLAALQPADEVTVTYHYAASSAFTITPSAGKVLIVNKVEVQFSEDIEMKDSFVFQAYGSVDVFAPQLMQPPYSLPSGTKIPLGDPLVYKTLNDLLNDSNHAYPSYPAVGNGNWRAMKKAAYIFAWDYDVGTTNLYASYGMEIRVSLQHDAVCGGEFATATLYSTSEDEVV